MAASQAVVIYGTASGIPRRIIIPDDDSQIARHQPGVGESSLLISSKDVSIEACRAAIEAATGLKIPSARCCIVSNGVVVGVCEADPVIDTHPAGTLVQNDNAGAGDLFVGGVFLREYAVVSKTTNLVTAIVALPVDDPDSGISALTSYVAPKSNLKVGDQITRKPAPVVIGPSLPP